MSAAQEATRNVARRLAEFARTDGDRPAVIAARRDGTFERRTFAELAADADRIARGLHDWGVEPGMRLALLVRPGCDFVALVFALLRAGVVQVLIDPGMGRRNVVRCLADVRCDGFVAPPAVQMVRRLLRGRFPPARWNVTVGRSLMPGQMTLDALRRRGERAGAAVATVPFAARRDDPAAIIFTTGSTGPPKGVLYQHGNFDRQVDEIRLRFQIAPGETNLACFPLFGLFNAAMGVTTVVPEMDASRPAQADPKKILAAVRAAGATQAFASPAVWNNVGKYCARHGERLPTLRAAYSAGAPVPPDVLQRMLGSMADGAAMHTPYGATEALPVATIEAREVLDETRHAWAAGRGTCVGRRFPGIAWKIIRIVDRPIQAIDEVEALPPGEIGELIVRGPVVTERYVTRLEANAAAKIIDRDGFWHRMGDAGYLDERERFWFCGRTAHRVQTPGGTLFTDPVEGVFNQHPLVFRSALVGVGPVGRQIPVVVVELKKDRAARRRFTLDSLRTIAAAHDVTRTIDAFLIHPSFPVDIRHNSKIFREQLAAWAERKLKGRR